MQDDKHLHDFRLWFFPRDARKRANKRPFIKLEQQTSFSGMRLPGPPLMKEAWIRSLFGNMAELKGKYFFFVI